MSFAMASQASLPFELMSPAFRAEDRNGACAKRVGGFARKLCAGAVVLVCTVLGIAGVVLPVIPGLVFLAIAAIVGARSFPSVATRLRRHRGLDRRLSTTDRVLRLGVWDRIRVAALLSAKAVADSLDAASRRVSRSGRFRT